MNNSYYIESFNAEEIFEYLRKSRSDDPMMSVEEVLERHEKILNDYAERNFGRIVPDENVFREIASSETIDDRPEMVKMLKAIESPKIKGVLVVEVQRLSRGDLEDTGRLIKLLRYTNTKVITPQKIYDLRDEYDRDAFERELKRGNEYLEYFKKIQARGKLLSVQEGNFIGSIPPYGYDKDFVTVGKKKCPTLTENKEQADIVRMIFDMYVNDDMGYKKICNRLDELGIEPPKGKYWSSGALKDMISNVHYIGKVKWNWRKTVTIVEEQEIIKTRPKAKIGEFLTYEGRHKGIVPDELFSKAKDKQGRNHRAKVTTKVRNPLAGILYCRCGRIMSLKYYKKADGTERCSPRFHCEAQSRCGTGSVIYDEIIEHIYGILKSCIEDFDVRIKNDEGDSVKMHQKLILRLENKMKKLEAKEIRQWEKYSDEGMPKHVFENLNKKVLEEKDEVQQALCKAYESMPEPIDYEEKIHRFTDALDALNNPDISAESKNKLLKSVFERIEYYREKPVRISKSNMHLYGIEEYKTSGGKWYSPPFELDVKLKL